MVCKSFRECCCIDLKANDPSITAWKSFRLSLRESRVLALLLMRVSQYINAKKGGWRVAPYVKRLNEILTGFECHLNAQIGEGLFIAHTQNLVIGADVVIGRQVTLYNGVTLGAGARGAEIVGSKYPTLEDGCTVYAGAKVLGSIKVGENAIVGANAVVLSDVPENKVAVGVPAKIIDRKQ